MSSISLNPLPFIEKWMPENLQGQSVLDYACGGGRHGRLAKDNGGAVTFVDINLSNVEDLLAQENVILLQADLEDEADEAVWPLQDRQYDLVIVTNYLYRPRLQGIFDLVAPDGMILYQTFAVGNEVFGKPSNPNFLLKEGELRDYCDGFEILHFEQGTVSDPSDAVIQRLVAKRVMPQED